MSRGWRNVLIQVPVEAAPPHKSCHPPDMHPREPYHRGVLENPVDASSAGKFSGPMGMASDHPRLRGIFGPSPRSARTSGQPSVRGADTASSGEKDSSGSITGTNDGASLGSIVSIILRTMAANRTLNRLTIVPAAATPIPRRAR